MTRSINEIGAGLAPARAGAPFSSGTRLHVMGVGGTAALGAALHARALGLDVTGCDHDLSAEHSTLLTDAGVKIVGGEASDHVRDRTHLAVSKAITSVVPNHPELAGARAAGIPLLSVQQVIADAAATRGGALLGVAGTHGKTTSTGWLLAALRASGRDPSAFVGGPLGAADGTPPGSPVHLGTEPGFIVEADEYGGNFDPYAADSAVILNADWDHPDIFADIDAVVATFASWARPVLARGVVVINVADPGGAAVSAALMRVTSAAERARLVTYAIHAKEPDNRNDRERLKSATELAHVDAMLVRGNGGAVALSNVHLTPQAIDLLPSASGLSARTLQIGLIGAHNASNALGVALLAAANGGSATGISSAIANFEGVGRRLQVLFDDGDRAVLDDYGHHPTAIRATIQTVRARYPERQLILAIEPLTYHRTAALLEQLAEAAALADSVVVADIFAVRDPDLTISSAEALAAAVARHGVPASAPGSVEAAADAIAAALPAKSVVLVMGGGRSTILATRLAHHLRS